MTVARNYFLLFIEISKRNNHILKLKLSVVKIQNNHDNSEKNEYKISYWRKKFGIDFKIPTHSIRL